MRHLSPYFSATALHSNTAAMTEDVSISSAETPLSSSAPDASPTIREPRLWHSDGWTARVIKNEDDEGWAVAMTQEGVAEPALVGPWTMGRDKKNPKPLDQAAFNTLVKTASEVLRRHEQQLRAMLHKSVTVSMASAPSAALGDITVTLDIVPDEFEPHAFLAAIDATGCELARVKTAPDFKLTQASAAKWIDSDFACL
jgi:hypothetical protein